MKKTLFKFFFLFFVIQNSFASNETFEMTDEAELLNKQVQILLHTLEEIQGDTSTEELEGLTQRDKIKVLIKRYQKVIRDLTLRIETHRHSSYLSTSHNTI